MQEVILYALQNVNGSTIARPLEIDVDGKLKVT